MKIQLKRSNQLAQNGAKPPSADQMEFGELAVNYNPTDPAIFIKIDKEGDNIIRIAGANSLGGFPDLDDNNGETLDERYVFKKGDSMSGHLGLPGGGGPADAVQRQEVEGIVGDTGNYVTKAGNSTTQDITGSGGISAEYYYANTGFVFNINSKNTGMYYGGSDNIVFKTNNNERLKIENGGISTTGTGLTVNGTLKATHIDLSDLPTLS